MPVRTVIPPRLAIAAWMPRRPSADITLAPAGPTSSSAGARNKEVNATVPSHAAARRTWAARTARKKNVDVDMRAESCPTRTRARKRLSTDRRRRPGQQRRAVEAPVRRITPWLFAGARPGVRRTVRAGGLLGAGDRADPSVDDPGELVQRL